MRIEMTLNQLRTSLECEVNKGQYCNVVIKRSREKSDTVVTINYADESKPRHAPIQSLLDFIQ